MNGRHTKLLVLLYAAIVPAGAIAAEENSEARAEVVETFTPPKPAELKGPRYPRIKQRMGEEGWVHLNFMISPEGKPYDIAVISSTDQHFERAAVQAAEEFKFEPAMLNGEAIDAGQNFRITFALSGPSGAARSFVKQYRSFSHHLSEQNELEIEATFAELNEASRNLYEEVYYQLALYQYLTYKKAPIPDRLHALNWASSFNHNDDYLREDTVTRLMTTRLSLELQVNKLATAYKTASELLQREIDEENRTTAESVIQQIDSIRNSDQSFRVGETIGAGNQGSHRLLKSSFSFDDVEGDIAELRLHCDKGRVGFIYKPDTVFSINPTWRDCTLILIGTPGTKFTLLEGV